MLPSTEGSNFTAMTIDRITQVLQARLGILEPVMVPRGQVSPELLERAEAVRLEFEATRDDLLRELHAEGLEHPEEHMDQLGAIFVGLKREGDRLFGRDVGA